MKKSRKKRSAGSKRWLKEHHGDVYVRRAKEEGYRSRAAYKLLEIQQRDKIFRPGMSVVDLGAAPGGWSQVAAALVKPGGRVIASDILPMEPLDGVEFIGGDFTEDAVLRDLTELAGNGGIDLVISDMAPNISGMADIDMPRAMYLAELAVDLAQKVLKPDGTLLIKVFQGEGFDDLLQSLKRDFARVVSRKPLASRARSAELYLLARAYKAS